MGDAILFSAIELACKAHSGQLRKGTRLPYIFHPLAVGRALLEAGFDNEIVAAGFLHDTIEDTPVKIAEISSKFGNRVASLVTAVSEKDKTDTWENRKKETIRELETAPLEVLAVSIADKLDNILSIRADLEKIGDEVWKRFKRSKESQKWYYSSLASVFEKRLTEEPLVSFVKSLRIEIEKVFGSPGIQNIA